MGFFCFLDSWIQHVIYTYIIFRFIWGTKTSATWPIGRSTWDRNQVWNAWFSETRNGKYSSVLFDQERLAAAFYRNSGSEIKLVVYIERKTSKFAMFYYTYIVLYKNKSCFSQCSFCCTNLLYYFSLMNALVCYVDILFERPCISNFWRVPVAYMISWFFATFGSQISEKYSVRELLLFSTSYTYM